MAGQPGCGQGAAPDRTQREPECLSWIWSRSMHGMRLSNLVPIAVMINTWIVVSLRRSRRLDRDSHVKTDATDRPWRERPCRTGAGPPHAPRDGVVHATAC